MPAVLLGNSYPLSLIRRAVRIEPRTLEELRQAVALRGCVSYWGHDNTLEVAKEFLGFDPAPCRERPALTLNGDGLPSLDGVAYDEVWVLSSDYRQGFRPDVGREVALDQILNWQVLRMKFIELDRTS